MQGELFRYSEAKRLVAFASGDLNAPTCLVLIPGLTDGLLALSYCEVLSQKCASNGITLIQPVFQSSYLGYGICALADDAQDLDELLSFLNLNKGKAKFALMGHSTGCQDILWYFKSQTSKHKDKVLCGILQAPVSDRDWLHHSREKDICELIDMAKKMGPNELMPRDTDIAPICSKRFLSLALKGYDHFTRQKFHSHLVIKGRR